jgi:hypothetical protein
MSTATATATITSNSSNTEISPQLRLPPYFPKSKGCKEAAEPFFKCFEEHAVKQSEDDKDAGVRGLSMCLKEKAVYEKCMAPLFDMDKLKKYRVR